LEAERGRDEKVVEEEAEEEEGVGVGGELPAACLCWRLAVVADVVSSWRPWFRRAATDRFVVDVRAVVPAGDVERAAVVDVDAEAAGDLFFRLAVGLVLVAMVLPPSTGPSSWASSPLIVVVVVVVLMLRFPGRSSSSSTR
jgi:hypothetical protein